MNFRLKLFLVVCVGILVGCSDTSDNTDKVSIAKTEASTTEGASLDTNVIEDEEIEDEVEEEIEDSKEDQSVKDKNLTLEIKQLEEKQKRLTLLDELNDETLKSSNKELLQELQKLKWSKEVLSEKIEFHELQERNSKEATELKKLEESNKKFTLISSLEEENLKYSQKELLTELQKLKWEKEVLSEKFELQKIQDEKKKYELKQKQLEELEQLQHKASLAEARATFLEQEMTVKRSLFEFNRTKVESEIALLKVKKERDNFIAPVSEYLDNPLSDDNQTLTISDRRVELNGVIYEETATMISSQINYFNNKDSKKPIFFVIDYSGGGSVLAGSLILKSIESSQAPVYVVLKSHAASMAAVIVTLADKSFAYPHATMLHHEIKGYSGGFSSLTEEREKYEDMKEAWEVFASPIAEKMGVTLDEYIKLLYKHSSKGNWKEFAPEAKKLKWVQNVVSKIEDKSVLVNPLYEEEGNDDMMEEDYYEGKVSNEKKRVHYLPKLRPTDMYFIYNPNGYYQIK